MYIFEHIGKTGGLSFYYYIKKSLPPNKYYQIPKFASEETNVRDLRYKKIILGHFANKFRINFPRAKYLSLIRNPIRRIISAFYHRVQFLDPTLPYASLEHFITHFDEKDRPEIKYPRKNWQSQNLLGQSWKDFFYASDDEIQQMLHSRFYIIGITEKYSKFIFFLHLLGNFPSIFFEQKHYRNKSQNTILDRSQIETIKDSNRLDLRVYDIANKSFDFLFDKKVMSNKKIKRKYETYSQCINIYQNKQPGIFVFENQYNILNIPLASANCHHVQKKDIRKNIIEIISIAQPYAYALSYEMKNFNKKNWIMKRKSIIIIINLKIIKGSIAIGALNMKMNQLIAENEIYNSSNDFSEVYLHIPKNMPFTHLIFRNTSATEPCHFMIKEIAIRQINGIEDVEPKNFH